MAAQLGVTHVAMESTGVYWKPVWNLLVGSSNYCWSMLSTLSKCPDERRTFVIICSNTTARFANSEQIIIRGFGHQASPNPLSVVCNALGTCLRSHLLSRRSEYFRESRLVGFSTPNFTRASEPTLSCNQLHSKSLRKGE
jgi:hypothetical protein